MVKKERRAKEVVTREYTINLHKKLHSTKFKSRAPKAVKEIRKFAQKLMGTKDVRLDVGLNKAVWSKGIKNVPTRLRVVISRRRNEDEDAKCQQWDASTQRCISSSGGGGRGGGSNSSSSYSRAAEEMYSFVSVAGDQTTKGKGPVVVQDS
ncbi:60S ribosomal protein L31 [Monoraphidium neglectum]|uniref:60S ribosomal protein L31 n=1 Tax=Monoraphidium neglectum TaxID=145388 RepID=A0A0D2N0Q2_9CHLO|nr:60S ribosomal protein L31 [Monoraphidium neglectum]KIY99900.1 60S ribosomal protein L31 [Monoraphidium neglectum]|eukprot:XP_013898920.1 60S ribosomal protein L31 [Monoraphidium neglectum]